MRAGVGAGTRTAVRVQETREPSARGSFGGMRQAALVALTALGGCVLLIVVGAAMSMCWAVHPLLTLVAAALVLGVGTRVAGYAFRAGGRGH